MDIYLEFMKASLRASNLLHNRLFSNVLNSTMSFFDTTPVGRLLNLFSRDLDESMHDIMSLFFFIINVFVLFMTNDS